jgi:lipopolysaccharide transport system ATP-binding protein
MGVSLVTVENVSKKFCRNLKRSLWYGLQDLSGELLGRASNGERQLRRDEFWALENISFELKPGECLALIGRNGAGKTTLLRILNGLIKPDRGRVEMRGRVGAMIALGAGFNPVLTGRENIYVNAAVLGLTKREVDKALNDIVAFADIGDFINTPVSFYSSGMQVRLGFSIAAHLEPDILLVDEVLAVGDMQFQRKCIRKIKELQDKDTGIIFVSHNMYLVQGICTRAILLNDGKEQQCGEVSKIISAYENQNQLPVSKTDLLLAHLMETRGTGEVEILGVKFRNAHGENQRTFSVGESISVAIDFLAQKRINRPVFSVALVRNDGLRCALNRTKFSDIEISYIEGNGQVTVEIEKLTLNSGEYLFEVAIADESITNPYALRKLDSLKIINPPMPNIGDSCGIYFLPVKWDVSKVTK